MMDVFAAMTGVGVGVVEEMLTGISILFHFRRAKRDTYKKLCDSASV